MTPRGRGRAGRLPAPASPGLRLGIASCATSPLAHDSSRCLPAAAPPRAATAPRTRRTPSGRGSGTGTTKTSSSCASGGGPPATPTLGAVCTTTTGMSSMNGPCHMEHAFFGTTLCQWPTFDDLLTPLVIGELTARGPLSSLLSFQVTLCRQFLALVVHVENRLTRMMIGNAS
ncbi:hypothetical protein PVAP13_4KG012900 [Panicum virgatum]|uniref:Uncharacterized protein n=1 Tax=Panicum virgatum TaxID=38727 RepID=A0A8T0TGZ5_PANVG|nr:hypothetical protein PVAP13_4KG012900 [Panicum virgatum]